MAAFGPLVRSLGARAWWGLGAVLLLGTIVELTGVLTGFPFGQYAYTDRWWPSVPLLNGGWFPLAVPFAWFLMAGASYLALGRGLAFVPLAGLLAASLDLVMEPVMVYRLGYWRWLVPGPLPGGAPLLNFLGWFATASLAALVLHALGAFTVKAVEPRVVLAGHLALTLGLGAIG